MIDALGLDIGIVNGKETPVDAKSLMKYTDEEAACDDFYISIVVSVLLYLSGHS